MVSGGWVTDVNLSKWFSTNSPVLLKTSKSDHHNIEEDIFSSFEIMLFVNRKERAVFR